MLVSTRSLGWKWRNDIDIRRRFQGWSHDLEEQKQESEYPAGMSRRYFAFSQMFRSEDEALLMKYIICLFRNRILEKWRRKPGAESLNSTLPFTIYVENSDWNFPVSQMFWAEIRAESKTLYRWNLAELFLPADAFKQKNIRHAGVSFAMICVSSREDWSEWRKKMKKEKGLERVGA